MKRRTGNVITCRTWQDALDARKEVRSRLAPKDREAIWYRGCRDQNHTLTPTLMRDTAGLSPAVHDQIERDLFFEFQARAPELRRLGLSEWEYLFYGRHFRVPTRLMDWTDTFGVAVYFAVENWSRDEGKKPAIWMMNPYALNETTWDEREITLPRYLGLYDGDFWDFGEMLAASGKWAWDEAVAIYPIQINERVRAQRGWFTIHGNKRTALEAQCPRHVAKLVLEPDCVEDAKDFLELAGFNQFSIYPDLDHLSEWLREQNLRSAGRRSALATAEDRTPRDGGTRRRKASRRKRKSAPHSLR
jgi:hypothetical protein